MLGNFQRKLKGWIFIIKRKSKEEYSEKSMQRKTWQCKDVLSVCFRNRFIVVSYYGS